MSAPLFLKANKITFLRFLFNSVLLLFAGMLQNSVAQTFNFKNFSLDEGLSQSEITCMFEDSRGFLWIGTSGGGLNRFDGKKFKIYEEKDGLCGQIISAISEDAEHNIWIGNVYGKLCVFNGQEFFNPYKNDPVYSANGKISFITVDDDNNMVIGKDNQLFLYNGKKFEKLTLKDDSIMDYSINCYKKDSRNIIWIGTSKGLLVLKNKILLRIQEQNGLDSINITSISEDVNGNLKMVVNNSEFFNVKIVGPSHYQVNVEKMESVQLPQGTFINDIHLDQRNQMWLASANKGIFKYKNKILENFNQHSGLPVDVIRSIYEDKSGTLWFGTYGGGIVQLGNRAFTYFENVTGLKENDIFGIEEDAKGNMWFGTSLHGVYKYDGKKISEFPDIDARCFYVDKKGNVWLGGDKGIIIYDGLKKYPYNKNKDCEKVRAFFEDKKTGKILIGTKGNGLFIDDGKETKQFKDPNGPNNNIYAFVQDKEGQIWMGTGTGIYIYRNGKIVKHLTEASPGYVGSLVKDKYGNIWAGTDDGVGMYRRNKFRKISIADGLTSGTVYLLNVDAYGNIWVGTNKGLDKISLNERGEIAAIRNYGKNEGFKGIECNSRATCIDANGYLWFGTIKGAIRLDPKEEFFKKSEIPQVHITGIKLFYENINWKKYADSVSSWYGLPVNAVLPYDLNHLTFDFFAFSKAFPENIKYSFKLEGFDKDWSPAAEINTTTYSNLPPGKYFFLVKAFNKSGMSSMTSEEFSFTIKAPFWTTWWFITICSLGLMGSVYFYNEYRKRRYFLFQKRFEKIIKQRTEEIAKQRDTNEILLKEVHHRVKNNLQIINSLINIQANYVDDPKAIEIFSEIRNRIRTITLVHEKLYKSKDYGNINVKEYINMLVEGLIDTYSFNKQIDLKLNLEIQYFNLNTIIPIGLLLNEIISNSFKYGFDDLEHGIIEVELFKSRMTDEYTLIIGDNGVGYNDELFKTESATLGLELIKILAAQLNGTIEKLDKPGTYYILKFKPLKD